MRQLRFGLCVLSLGLFLAAWNSGALAEEKKTPPKAEEKKDADQKEDARLAAAKREVRAALAEGVALLQQRDWDAFFRRFTTPKTLDLLLSQIRIDDLLKPYDSNPDTKEEGRGAFLLRLFTVLQAKEPQFNETFDQATFQVPGPDAAREPVLRLKKVETKWYLSDE